MSTQHGYFLIADITGYTAYLSQSELEHAQQTLTALLNLLIQHTQPPLIISRLAGDAVISYGLRDNFLQPRSTHRHPSLHRRNPVASPAQPPPGSLQQ